MPVQSTPRRTEHEIRVMEQKKSELEALPAIDFWHVDKNTLSDDQKYDKNKDHHVTLEVPMDPNNDSEDAQMHTLRIRIFEAGTAEDYCYHRMKVHEAAARLGYFRRMCNNVGQILDVDDNPMTEEEAKDRESDQLIPLAKSTLSGHAGQVFNKYLDDHENDANGNPIPSRTRHVMAWNAVALMIFQLPESAALTQKCYLREGGLKFCGQCREPRKFYERLDLISQHITHFPMHP